MTNGIHRNRTLLLVTVLHAFTHIFHVALMPLYLPMVKDLGFPSVDRATILVSIMMIAYYLPSYPMGVLADRLRAKGLLGWGLALDSVGFIGLGFCQNFWQALFCVVVAGLGGSCFHPAATSLLVRLFHEARGRALGISAVGAGLGFFIGPLYSGWRGESAGWRSAVIELGFAGIAMSGVFAWLADDVPLAHHDTPARRNPPKPDAALVGAFLLMAVCFALRDFGGAGNATLSSLYLQQAHGDTVETSGRVLSVLFVTSMVSSPLFGHLSDRRRTATATGLILVSAVLLGSLPFLPRVAFPWVFTGFGFFFMASYPVVEAGLMEILPAALRGRAFGLFITIGGITGNLSHWLLGIWVHQLGPAAKHAESYRPVYLCLAGLVAASVSGLVILRRLRAQHRVSGGWFSHFSTPAPEAKALS